MDITGRFKIIDNLDRSGIAGKVSAVPEGETIRFLTISTYSTSLTGRTVEGLLNVLDQGSLMHRHGAEVVKLVNSPTLRYLGSIIDEGADNGFTQVHAFEDLSA